MQTLVSFIPLPALMAGGVALFAALLLVATQSWHGHHTMDSDKGIQKFHTHPTPRVGGIAIALGIVMGYLFADSGQQSLLGPLMVAGIPAFASGLLEDITKRVSVRTRLLATMSCGVLGWAITGHSITNANMHGLNWLLGFTFISVAFTAFAVGGIANAINIIDGFNGLAAGTVLIILFAFGMVTTQRYQRGVLCWYAAIRFSRCFSALCAAAAAVSAPATLTACICTAWSSAVWYVAFCRGHPAWFVIPPPAPSCGWPHCCPLSLPFSGPPRPLCSYSVLYCVACCMWPYMRG